MNVQIMSNGKLVVTPDNMLETYALEQWGNEYFGHVKCDGDCKAVFSIKLPPQAEKT